MRFELHHYHDHQILRSLDSINLKLETIMATLADLKAKVEANTAVVDSARELLAGLKVKLDEAIANLPDPAALEELSNQLGADTQELADAVAQNTPSA